MSLDELAGAMVLGLGSDHEAGAVASGEVCQQHGRADERVGPEGGAADAVRSQASRFLHHEARGEPDPLRVRGGQPQVEIGVADRARGEDEPSPLQGYLADEREEPCPIGVVRAQVEGRFECVHGGGV